MSLNLNDFCKSLPKIELHAHLNGSLSDSTILRLIDEKQKSAEKVIISETSKVNIQKGDQRTLAECFEIFKIIHQLLNSLEDVRTITKNVIREFAEDNVIYLELRTTPKALSSGSTKSQYIETVMDSIEEVTKELRKEGMSITVKLLLSVDRGRTMEDARNTVDLAKHYFRHEKYKDVVCGVDVSGDPRKGDLMDYIPLLEDAISARLKTSVHLAEIQNDKETVAVLEKKLVHRIGHGTYIHPSMGGTEHMQCLVKEQNIPIEICVSSNIKSGTVADVSNHHFKYWYEDNHPVIICTDDKGVFSTSLTEEYYLCAQNMGLSAKQLANIALLSVNATFLESKEKDILRYQLQEKITELLQKTECLS